MCIFGKADILLPKDLDYEKWSVIACDQFTSQPDYWEKVIQTVSGQPSSLNLIFPEVWLEQERNKRRTIIENIHSTMHEYLESNIFTEYPNSYIYVERSLLNGLVRKGVIGVIDLEEYDYSDGSVSAIRATEKTVIERIPPRMEIRQEAEIELTHVILLCDDENRECIEYLERIKNKLPVLYDFNLMQGGGQIKGWLVNGKNAEQFDARLSKYIVDTEDKYAQMNISPMFYAVGDGNHSLATAKACYEAAKSNNLLDEEILKKRYALVELENLNDEAQQLEPIHRIVGVNDICDLLNNLKMKVCTDESNGYPINWYSAEQNGVVYLNKKLGELPVGILQEFLDDYLIKNGGYIDYIHDISALKSLCDEKGAVGFELPAIEKEQLFLGIAKDGVLPRKTFSMGHAKEKRYYLEARRIV